MKDLQIFQLDDFNVRTIGEWFVGKDVAECLGYEAPRNAIARHVGAKDKKSKLIPQPRNGALVSKAVLINESGVYSLIFGSKLESAKKFQHWVTSEVLPSIRKQGVYMTPDVLEESIKNPDYMIGLLNELKKNQKQIEEQAPKVEMAEQLLLVRNCIPMGEYAKLIGKGRNKLFRQLKEMGIVDRNCVAYQRYINQGYFKLIETVRGGHTYVSTLITGKGQEWLLKTLRKEIY